MKSGTFTNNTSFTATAAQVNVPTGSIQVGFDIVNFTVPTGITVLHMYNRYIDDYVGVTPNTTHGLWYDEELRGDIDGEAYEFRVVCHPHGEITYYMEETNDLPGFVTVEWSPEINKHSVDVNHYNI